MTLINYRHFLKSLVFVFLIVALSGCQIDSKPQSDLDKIRERGVLRVGVVNNQLSYFIGPDGPSGIDYELARDFANELGVKLEIKPVFRVSALFPALKRGEIDIIAAGQTQTLSRIKRFRAGPAYYYVSQQVVYRQGQWKPRSIKQIVSRQARLAEESPDETIFAIVDDSHLKNTLVQAQKSYPNFTYELRADSDINDLLKQVSEGKLMFTLADSVEVSLAQRVYPDLATAFELTEDQPISWYIRRSDDESLYALMIEFFGNEKQSGILAQLEEKYIGHVRTFDYVDTRAFIRALETTLPDWTPVFQKYSDEFDWRLVAALSYQESHWNPRAISPTGVRGMMMLTLPTAKSVGVANRLNPEQSIRGGVEYLRRMVARIPDSIPEHEKIWFALASYNMGYGHMMDARRLTKSQGGDPDSWSDVKDRLPLLQQQKYFRQTRYGYARGNEAKAYVENIRQYYQSIIGHIEQQDTSNNDSDINDLKVIKATSFTPENNNNPEQIGKEIEDDLQMESQTNKTDTQDKKK
ncbi:membrane-bound lytic murein transglycosylase MltF [Vibrio sp.]|uniref:Membrane-bound lytic murein transglycosylase F n=1 Tax=Vibrio viridaestus TaxID=2487322 RepID=A0A3N9TZL6_9VIBR|nr:membrane-bound lytic murein transglycosylase MltF [Vibrio viridaestus]MDC0610451.1 membrane-bound lytic murein transglycosylase MltF [Vibrio sp.]RQW62412.1 membrane-bound lytic murein transglycosylase MltF [Vibrio viridaestus]